MNIKQERYLSMLLGIESYLSNNTTITALIPNFAAIFAPFTQNVNAIRDIEQAQNEGTTVVSSQSKKDLRMQCTMQLETVLDAMAAYAVIRNNAALKINSNPKRSEIRRTADTTFATECDRFHKMANGIVTQIEPYGVNAALLTTFRANIDEFINIAVGSVLDIWF